MKYEVYAYHDLGFKSLMQYEGWRVAILNYIQDCHIDHLKYFEAHQQTDEVFVLLEGEATLIFADIDQGNLIDITSINLEKNKVYNIKRGVYHTQVLSEDAKLFIVENAHTGDDNSIKFYLSQKDIQKIKESI